MPIVETGKFQVQPFKWRRVSLGAQSFRVFFVDGDAKENFLRGQKEALMKKSFLVVSMLAAFLLAAVTVGAQTIDDKIKALEQELNQLKEQQIEMKKDATAAAAALPTFSYRPGNGMLIEAADKSWSFRAAFESHMRYDFETGRASVGRSQGELMGRRFRPEFYLCVDNCLWEIDWRLDLDGFGTNTALQAGQVYFHGENISPWLPRLQLGMDTTNTGPNSLSRQGSGNVGAQAEYDLLSRNDGFNTGSASYGTALTWDDRSLAAIGIPGRIGRYEVSMAAFGEGGDGTQLNTDRKDFATYLSLMPMSELKNKWLSGFTFEYGAWFCNVDPRQSQANGCNRYRVQDHGDGGRQTLFDTGGNSIGRGLHVAQGPGIVYSVGPYTLRAMGRWENSEDGAGSGPGSLLSNTRGKKKSHNWLIGHDLYVWSPKGFLTGSSTTPGSILTGTHFERADLSIACDANPSNGFTAVPCSGTGGLGGHLGQFHRNRILLREWDLWYVLAPRLNMGINILWYDAANLDNRVNQAGQNLGLCSANAGRTATNCRNGAGGDWIDVFLNLRYYF